MTRNNEERKLTVAEIKELTAGKNALEIAEVLSRKYEDSELSSRAYEVKSAGDRLRVESNRVKEIGSRIGERLVAPQNFRDETTWGPWYSGVSGSGELQGTAISFDIACALYDRAFAELSRVIAHRMITERKAARLAYRETFTGFKREVMNHVQQLGSVTISAIWKSFTPGYCTRNDVEQAVIELGQAPDPFVWHKVNAKNQITAVWYEGEVRR